MSVNVIDTLKPKNGLSFPVVEAIDVFVENYGNLADAISHFATDAMIAAINAVLSGKANTSDVNTAVSGLQAQIDQIAQAAGTGSADTEVAQARVDETGTTYSNLKSRLDAADRQVDDLYDINNIIASKGQTFAGAKVAQDSARITSADQDKFRCLDIDYDKVKDGKLYAILNISNVSPIVYIVGRDNSGAELFNSLWQQFENGTDLLTLIASKDKTGCKSLSITYAFTTDGTTTTIQTGIDELDYQLYFATTYLQGELDQFQEEIEQNQQEIEQNKESIESLTKELYQEQNVHNYLDSTSFSLDTEYLWIETSIHIPQLSIPVLNVKSGGSGDLVVLFLSKSSDAYTILSSVTVSCRSGNNQVVIPNADTIADNGDVYLGFYSTDETIRYVSSTLHSGNVVTRIEYEQATGTFTPSGEYKIDFSYELKVTSKISTIEQLSDKVDAYDSKIIVVSPTNGDYSNLLTAITTEPENTTILVKPGTYDIDMTSCLKKRIILIGSDRNQCIIRDTDGRYGHHPLYVSCGYFENLTIVAPYVSGESQEIGVSDLGAYAVHIDTDDDYGVGKQIEFHHCTIKSDFFPAIGAGLRKDLTLIIDGCELVNNQISGRGDYSDEGTLGAVYVHNTNGVKGNQYLKIKDSVLKSNLGNALCLYQTSAATSEDTVICEFVNNALYDKINGLTNNIWFRGDPFSETTGRFENALGYGNSNNDLNM